jgi:cell division protein FtsB
VVLALVLCALVLSVAVPLRNYLSQRGELAEVQQQQQRLREQVDELERRKAELSDPAQIEAEARRRLRYVRPGETPYVVPLPGGQQSPAPAPGEQPAEQPQPWHSDLLRPAGESPDTGTGH